MIDNHMKKIDEHMDKIDEHIEWIKYGGEKE